MEAYFGDVWLVRLLLQRGVAAIYFVAFLSALQQFRPLLGERGLLPVSDYLSGLRFMDAPSLFHFRYSDRRFAVVAWGGLALSLVALTGLSERGPFWLSMTVWLVLYALYLSIVNVGQTFYSFGWESMLLEAGFFAAFLGPTGMRPSLMPVLALRWMLFRTELGAGLIKLRNDRCWRDLTCLFFHHETQPMPNALSRHFHHLPRPIHKLSVLFSHFVQIVVPVGLFAPQPISSIAGAFLIGHQLLLVVSGNYAWLNWLTIVLGFSAFGDGVLAHVLPLHPGVLAARPVSFEIVLYGLGAATLLLSIKPALNLLSEDQAMNATYNPFHIVGSYGAFGSVTRKRLEIVLEGTNDEPHDDTAEWRAYEFKGKPGDPSARPRQWAPYHLRLDWLMWFLPLRTMSRRTSMFGYEVWFLRFVEKLLEADRAVLRLLARDPFDGVAPRHVRARTYRYEFTTRRERAATGNVWKRTLVGDYLAPVGREAFAVSTT